MAYWLNLIIRWAHVMFGIAWIGASLYFMWLDASLEPPDPPRQGVAGEVWSVHGGGFYRVEKFGVAPPALPRRNSMPSERIRAISRSVRPGSAWFRIRLNA